MGVSGTYGGKPKPRGCAGKPRQLSEKQQKFIEAFLRTGSTKQAAIAGGYAGAEGKHGSQIGNQVKRAKAVRDAIEAAQKRVVAKGVYSLEQAMKEADDAILFSRATENANAYVKAVELKAKLNGLLIEKHEINTTPFQIMISGINRAALPAPAIPVEVKEITQGEK